MSMLLRFARDEDGATAIEYGLLAAILGIGLIAALSTLKTNLAGVFNTVGSAAANAANGN
jgi:pilus assembly protein Flp/PilA